MAEGAYGAWAGIIAAPAPMNLLSNAYFDTFFKYRNERAEEDCENGALGNVFGDPMKHIVVHQALLSG